MLPVLYCVCVCAMDAAVLLLCVQCCSEVSMLPSTVMGSRKITIKGGADVTNQTCLHPGVTVMPGACLGVFTYAEAERTFPRDSIVQVSNTSELVGGDVCACVFGCTRLCV